MKREKLFQVSIFIVLVCIFSAIGILIKNRFGMSIGFAFTMVALPIILRVLKVKDWKIG